MLITNMNFIRANKIIRYQCTVRNLCTKYEHRLRADAINKLKSCSNRQNQYDILIIGGGSTGAGAALDAASRGLKTACVEKEDFSSGTSSRSTKLIWGGSRYLVQALISLFSTNLIKDPKGTIKKFIADFKMVVNCHRERKFLLDTQPHLTTWVPIAVPLKSWLIWPPPFNYYPAAIGPLGLFPLFFKFYDSLSGFSSPPSHIMTPSRAKRKFPQLNHTAIKYCSIFYEGMHDDSRTNLAIALTAADYGATIANYCEVIDFIHESPSTTTTTTTITSSSTSISSIGSNISKQNKIIGVILCDRLTGDTFPVYSKSIMICGGPFTDQIRQLEYPKEIGEKAFKPAVNGSSGIHIILPSYFSPPSFGFVDMNTSDGRFLFFLPWQGHVLVGTTDHKCIPHNHRPEPLENEILWLLNEASKYLSPELKLQRKHVLSAWSGIRPLAIDPHQLGNTGDGSNTAAASRDHIVSYNPDTGVVFVAGGKWTTYREMAEDGVNKIIEVANLEAKRYLPKSNTLNIKLVGHQGYSLNLAVSLIQEFGDSISYPIATHLVRTYGGLARDVLMLQPTQQNITTTVTTSNHINSTSSSINNVNNNGNNNNNIKGSNTVTSTSVTNPLHNVIISGYPYIEAEVIYAIRYEYAMKVEDIIARRTRIAFLNRDATLAAIPRIVQIMSKELHWSLNRIQQETHDSIKFMQSFGGTKPLYHLTNVKDASIDSETAGIARIATLADIQHIFTSILHTLQSSSSSSSSSSTADITSGESQKPLIYELPYHYIELVGEMLHYTLSVEEIQDCILYSQQQKQAQLLATLELQPPSLSTPSTKSFVSAETAVDEKSSRPLSMTEKSAMEDEIFGTISIESTISLQHLYEWWNSDRLNPYLQDIKKTHTASASSIQGTGTFFG